MISIDRLEDPSCLQDPRHWQRKRAVGLLEKEKSSPTTSTISANAKIYTSMHTCLHTYVRTYVHTYLRTYVDTYVQTCRHTHIHTYGQTDRQTYIQTNRRTLPASSHLGCPISCGKFLFRLPTCQFPSWKSHVM